MTRAEYIALYPGTHQRDTSHTGAVDFRASVLAVVGRLVVKQTHQIHRDVEAELGETDKRRVNRALAKMVREGVVIRIDGGYRRAKVVR